MDSIVIKVAGAGLRVRHLGLNVAGDTMRHELQILVRLGRTFVFFTLSIY
jgi:hypothetical protein